MAFHVELRQFPHVDRAFNLSGAELGARLLEPWVAGRTVELQERRWDPERARLTIYEGPKLRPEQIGLGRGWANVTRSGAEVTEALLAKARGAPEARVSSGDLKAAVLKRCASEPLALGEVVALVGTDRGRASERLALAEEAVWELLHAGAVRLVRDGEAAAPDRWRSVLFSW
ncbi:MAG: hypothetical protein M3018_09340, partial [Actinomycetota bacterium]|nr:hypothetical protein [Actinomycetota bacterium]